MTEKREKELCTVNCVPYVPTPEEEMRRALQTVDLHPGQIFLELGCGDGRNLKLAASEFGATCIGYEIDSGRARLAHENTTGLPVTIKQRSFLDAANDIAKADVIYMYLLQSVNQALKPLLEAHLKPNAVVISRHFTFDNWAPLHQSGDNVYYYAHPSSLTQEREIIVRRARASPCPPLGDVTGNGVITDKDAELVEKYVIGVSWSQISSETSLSELEFWKRADVDGQGLDMRDPTLIRRFARGEIGSFPGCSAPTVPNAEAVVYAVGASHPDFKIIDAYLEYDGKKAYPGDVVEIAPGTKVYPACEIQNYGDGGGDCAIRVDTFERNLFRTVQHIAPHSALSYQQAEYFIMPSCPAGTTDCRFYVKFLACHYNGNTDGIHDQTDIILLKPTPPTAACTVSTEKSSYKQGETVTIQYSDAPIGSTLYIELYSTGAGRKQWSVSGNGTETYTLPVDATTGLWQVALTGSGCSDKQFINVAAAQAPGCLQTFRVVDENGIGVSDARVHLWNSVNMHKNTDASGYVTFHGLQEGKAHYAQAEKGGYETSTKDTFNACTGTREIVIRKKVVPTGQWSKQDFINDMSWRGRIPIENLPDSGAWYDMYGDNNYARYLGECNGKGFGISIRLKSRGSCSGNNPPTEADCISWEYGDDHYTYGVAGSVPAACAQAALDELYTHVALKLDVKKPHWTKDGLVVNVTVLNSNGEMYQGTYRYTYTIGVTTQPGKVVDHANPSCFFAIPKDDLTGIAKINIDLRENDAKTGASRQITDARVTLTVPEYPEFHVTVSNAPTYGGCLDAVHVPKGKKVKEGDIICTRDIKKEGQTFTFTVVDGFEQDEKYAFFCGMHYRIGSYEPLSGCIPYFTKEAISSLYPFKFSKMYITVHCPPIMEPVYYKICEYFDIPAEKCTNWCLTFVSDPVFLADELSIVKEGKDLNGNPVQATPLEYAFVAIAIAGIATPGFAEGKIIKKFKELIELAKGNDEIAVILRSHEAADFLASTTYEQIDRFYNLIKGKKFRKALELVDNVLSTPEIENPRYTERINYWFDLLDKELPEGEAVDVFAKYGITGEYKSLISRLTKYAKEHPYRIMVTIMAIWFCVDNLPFYIKTYLKATGSDVGDKSFKGNQWCNTLKADSFNAKNAIDIKDWKVAKKAITLFEEHLTEYKSWLDANAGTLQREQSYDVLLDTYETYEVALEIAKKSAGFAEWPSDFTAVIRHARDGDSMEFEYRIKEGKVVNFEEEGGETARTDVRLVGINTPELHDKGGIRCTTTTPSAFNVDPKLADDAKQAMLQLENTTVTIQTDPNNLNDVYGRLLGVVRSNGVDQGLEQIKNGYACYYFREPHSRVDEAAYKEAEAAAKAAHIGIWALPLPDIGKIKCSSKPSNAEIWLDGEKTNFRTTRTLEDIAVGEHTVTFKAPAGCTQSYDKCQLLECTRHVTVVKDKTVDVACNLCAIYEILQPFYYPNGKKTNIDPYIRIDGTKTNERTDPSGVTHIKFGVDESGNNFTFGDAECGFGKHTIELYFTGHKTVRGTATLNPGKFISVTPEIPLEKENVEPGNEEVVSPTPTPPPGETPESPKPLTAVFTVNAAIDSESREEISQYGIKILIDDCDCHHRPPETMTAGDDKFCDKNKQCPFGFDSHELQITKKNYSFVAVLESGNGGAEREVSTTGGVYSFSISAGDEISITPILEKSTAGAATAIVIAESIIPAIIYLNTPVEFVIKVRNTGDFGTPLSVLLSFEGVDVDRHYSFKSEISHEVAVGDSVGIPVTATLPDDAVPPDRTTARYDIYAAVSAYAVPA